MTEDITKSIAAVLAAVVINRLAAKYINNKQLQNSKEQLSQSLGNNPEFIKQIQATKSMDELIQTGERIVSELQGKTGFQKGVIMKEDMKQKEVRLTKELAKVRAINANVDSKLRPTKDFSVGIPQDTSVKKKLHSAEVPDVITLPPKQKNRKENIPF
tara:strand:- start:742 stop:1215 length:474 start_codon:yes stop_codon:yes gene_type:complete